MTFRKSKITPPFFNIPSPFNPVITQHAPLSLSAPYCRFVLDTGESLDSATEKAYGHITHQWGPGARHSFKDRIAIYNFIVTEADEEEMTDAVYGCSLGEGEAGFAVWDVSQRWVMICSGGGGGNAVATTTEIIPKREGLTPGGPIECIPYMLSQDPDTGVYSLVTTGKTVEVFSWIKSDSSDPDAEEGGILWIFIEQDEYGVWWFTGEDCPSAGY